MPSTKPSTYSIVLLYALGKMGKHVYPGTVTARVKQARRRKDKAARTARRANR